MVMVTQVLAWTAHYCMIMPKLPRPTAPKFLPLTHHVQKLHQHAHAPALQAISHHSSLQHMQFIDTADVIGFLSAHVHAGVIKHFQEPDVWLLSGV